MKVLRPERSSARMLRDRIMKAEALLKQGGTFSEAVYRAVYSPGQFAQRSSAPRGAARSAEPIACASADGAAPSAELSALAPRC